jgi:hypothetical protein
MNSDPERDDTLLDAVLRDENWQTASAAFKAEALGIFRARQRLRRLTRWAGSAMVLAAAFVGLAHWLSRPATAPRPVTVARVEAPKTPDTARNLTDQELVAAFPQGSCFIAEVDGKKELVFLDPAVGRSYLAQPGLRGN